MKLIIGLGNPGPQYTKTRHNVGFLCLDYIANKLGKSSDDWKNDQKLTADIIIIPNKYILLKPQTFMNRSGEAVTRTMQFYKLGLQDITVIHDDLDIKIGIYKISIGKGPKLHNGTSSIENKVGKDFQRVRIGVENRTPENRIPGESYVLQDFTTEEMPMLTQVFEDICKQIAP